MLKAPDGLVHMSRQQRRRIARKGISPEELRAMREQDIRMAVSLTIRDYHAVMLLCLRDKLGFGRVRALRFLEDINEVFDSVRKGYLDIDDIRDTVEKELGIKVDDL